MSLRQSRLPAPCSGNSPSQMFRKAVPGLLTAMVIVGALFGTCGAWAQVVDPNLYVTNGSVSSSVVLGNTLYIGGQFTEVGPATGAGVPTDSVCGK